MESNAATGGSPRSNAPAVRLQLLGAMSIERYGVAIELPASRKVRALIAYLALAGRALARSSLCELLWDVPNDPRGELRWCLSKARVALDGPDRRRVCARGDLVHLDLTDVVVDALDVVQATAAGIDALDVHRQRALAAQFAGEFLAGLAVDRLPAFNGWLVAQRRRFRSLQASLLESLARQSDDDEAIAVLGQWIALAPFEPRAHAQLLRAFARTGRLREGEAHLDATVRAFEAERLAVAPLREAWRSARSQETTRSDAGDGVTAITLRDGDASRSTADTAKTRRASIAVLPLIEQSPASGPHAVTGDGLAHDVVTRLAKLRALHVIAQGTTFALRDRNVAPDDAARMLGVDYLVSGAVRRNGGRVAVTVELADTRTSHVVWAETFNHRPDDAFVVLDEIGDSIVASVAGEVEAIERSRAMLRPPSSLDAWEAHHRGLWHMIRFNRRDNEQARHFFEHAVGLDPTFARAHAGLSFTHFQDAFQGWARHAPASERAFTSAAHSLIADERDPAAHWAMGRAQWLRGSRDEAIDELRTSVELSPNFALAHYTLAFVQAQDGDAEAALGAADESRRLSPFDPLLFGMLGARAIALVRLKRFDEAAQWAAKAAARPNAHAHIFAIAAYTAALAGDLDNARSHAGTLHRLKPDYRFDDFSAAFRFDAEGKALFGKGAKRMAMA